VLAPQLHIHIYEVAVTVEKTPQEHFKGNLSVNSGLTKTNMNEYSHNLVFSHKVSEITFIVKGSD